MQPVLKEQEKALHAQEKRVRDLRRRLHRQQQAAADTDAARLAARAALAVWEEEEPQQQVPTPRSPMSAMDEPETPGSPTGEEPPRYPVLEEPAEEWSPSPMELPEPLEPLAPRTSGASS